MLWITTQDRRSVINVKEVTVNGKKIKGIVNSTTLDEWSKDLGKYESTERAVEILHEIFMKMEENTGPSVTFAMPEK